MTISGYDAIDCDIHPAVPNMQVLMPYLDDYWRDHLTSRGTDRITLHLTSYPPNAPLSSRPDWRVKGGLAGQDVDQLRTQALDAFGSRFAICNPIYAAQVLYNEDMSAVLCSAVNQWFAREWLDRDPRLRASIMVPSSKSPQLTVEEIERCAGDKRFVQVLMLCQNELPLGRRYYWPVYEAAERHGLPIAIHAGSSYRHAPSNAGFPSFFVEEYAGVSQNFKGQLLNMIAEGVFVKFPNLKVILAEAGFTWLPNFCWRADKIWRGVRREVPWVKEAPSEYIKRHVRFTLQPIDAPENEPKILERVIDQMGSDDLLLFSTDYPHWHFEGTDALPKGFPEHLKKKVLFDNPLATYGRIRDAIRAQEKEVA